MPWRRLLDVTVPVPGNVVLQLKPEAHRIVVVMIFARRRLMGIAWIERRTLRQHSIPQPDTISGHAAWAARPPSGSAPAARRAEAGALCRQNESRRTQKNNSRCQMFPHG